MSEAERTYTPNEARIYLEGYNAALRAQEPMIHGYDVEHLELVAELMRKHDITPDDLKKCVDNFENTLKLVMEVQEAKAIEVLSAREPKGADQ